jgi:predicted metal-dependent HD superfamily phosphohydrolase
VPSSARAADLAGRWNALCEAADLTGAAGEGGRLIAAYSEPHRRYHGLAHLAFLLDEVDRRSEFLGDREVVALAAWYHDAVYDPQAKDNERRSAIWAVEALAAAGFAPERTRAVEAMILKTASHHAGEASIDEALFLDMDFAILGAPPAIYAEYAENIRAEYAHVPDDRFRAGRGAFLKAILAQPNMFRTALYERELGAQARANISSEIMRLSA